MRGKNAIFLTRAKRSQIKVSVPHSSSLSHAPSRSLARSTTLTLPNHTHPHTRIRACTGPGLMEWERSALASARWPARAQVVEGKGQDDGDGAGVLGGVRGETYFRCNTCNPKN